ncbi:MAG TPA: Clp protease N-terminal domain-containing protein [Aldersonia sp.]
MLGRLKSMGASMRFMKHLFGAAETHADRDGEPAPCPEHLLLAAARSEDGIALRVLDDVGVDVEALGDAVARARADLAPRPAGEETIRHAGVFIMTEPAQEAFQAAGRYSRSEHVTLNSGHVLAGVTTLHRGAAVSALRLLGVDRSALHAAAREAARHP